MRLIDADNLIAEILTQDLIGDGKRVDKIILDAPTVEAIPIEWVERWINNIANDERYKNEYVELTEEVKRIVYRQTVIIKIPCISDMLEDWRKESEINRRG